MCIHSYIDNYSIDIGYTYRYTYRQRQGTHILALRPKTTRIPKKSFLWNLASTRCFGPYDGPCCRSLIKVLRQKWNSGEDVSVAQITLLKTNMEPEKGPLIDYCHLQGASSQVPC